MLLCPNCDHVLNAIGCQACGWKVGNVFSRDTHVFPFRVGAQYPGISVSPASGSNVQMKWAVPEAPSEMPPVFVAAPPEPPAPAPVDLANMPATKQ